MDTNHHLTIDGCVLPKSPYEAYRAGENHEQAQLQGCNAEEAAPFVLLGGANRKNYADKVRSLWPLQTEGVEKALQELWEEEKKPSPNADRLCNLSGEMLGAVFAPRPDDVWSPVLRSVGVSLGRFIYWMDAWEDLDADVKKHRFNPLVQYRSRSDYEDFCKETLELLIAEAAESFEILPLEQDLDLLRNVIYSGVWQRYILKTEQKQKHRKEGVHGQ